jgi:hypothetical protein
VKEKIKRIITKFPPENTSKETKTKIKYIKSILDSKSSSEGGVCSSKHLQ